MLSYYLCYKTDLDPSFESLPGGSGSNQMGPTPAAHLAVLSSTRRSCSVSACNNAGDVM